MRLCNQFGSPEAVLSADLFALTQQGLKPDTIAALSAKEHPLAVALLETLEKKKIGVVTYRDADYPQRLLQISDFPPLLFYKGDITCLNRGEWLAVVGSRKVTSYGRQLCASLLPPLVASGLGIASGFALGVDMEAHLQTLRAGGITAAVLGSGLEEIYPASHNKYVAEVMSHGVMVSEFVPFERARPEYFPRRNRIISGLSRGVLVIEAGLDSGSLITARCALDQNRDVFAVPGPVTSPQSEGCHQLIAQGAKLVARPEDILEDWMMQAQKTSKPEPILEPEEKSIYDCLAENPCLTDDIVDRTGLKPARVLTLLTGLELKGLLKFLPGQYVSRVP